jgi:hypothetical protein
MQNCARQGYCYAGASCGSSSCAGCCTATGECLGGADAPACGQFGTLCDNCSAKNQSCVGHACSTGSTCPGTYAGCNPGAITDPPKTSASCSADELASIVAACGGAGTRCGPAFNKLLVGNPACAGCLSQFVGDQAITRCLSPYLNPSCNHALTCGVECTNSVCGQCPPGATKDKCTDGAGQSGGACNAYIYGFACALAAFQGPAAFCNWDMYKDAGLWIDAVGRHYCQ